MKIHQMKLTSAPFTKIKSGNKIIESRLYDEKRQLINIGDEIEFINTDDLNMKILTHVKAIYRYQSFSELFSDFNPEFFGRESKEDLIKEIEQFYSKEDQQKYGVVGIKIKMI